MTTAVTAVPGSSCEPPAGFNARAELDELNELPLRQATLEVDLGRLLALRRRAVTAQEPATGSPARDRVVVEFRDPEQLAEELASYG
ncbi:hypothetical protein SB847_21355, partial [Bacillus sp. SIMBA_026]